MTPLIHMPDEREEQSGVIRCLFEIAPYLALFLMLLAGCVMTVPHPYDPPANVTVMPVSSTLADSRPVTVEIDGEEMEMIFIPPGPFAMGSAGGPYDESPMHMVSLDGFWIGKTEVTYAQYSAFVQDVDFHQPARWEDWGLPARQDDHPILAVSWYDAMAYSQWMTDRLRELASQQTEHHSDDEIGEAERAFWKGLHEGALRAMLPSEAEWEKACRGTDGRIFPWGNEPPDGTHLNLCDVNCKLEQWRADIDDGYRYMAPVGSYSNGASPYGVLDMSGNLLEWTRTYWGTESLRSTAIGYYPYDSEDGRESLEEAYAAVRGLGPATWHIMRSAGWDSPVGVLSCSDRVRNPSDTGFPSFGFRVVVSTASLAGVEQDWITIVRRK